MATQEKVRPVEASPEVNRGLKHLFPIGSHPHPGARALCGYISREVWNGEMFTGHAQEDDCVVCVALADSVA